MVMKSNDPLLLGAKVGVYGIAWAGGLGGDHAYGRNAFVCQINKIRQWSILEGKSTKCSKSGTSMVVYNLSDLKVFCNTGIVRKLIGNYHFIVSFF